MNWPEHYEQRATDALEKYDDQGYDEDLRKAQVWALLAVARRPGRGTSSPRPAGLSSPNLESWPALAQMEFAL